MKQIRQAEWKRAGESAGFTPLTLDFPDLQLSYLPPENVVVPLLKLFRTHAWAAIFSFHPHEVSKWVDHPDHNAAGDAARRAAMAVDVKHFHPEFPAPAQRPKLFLWSTQSHLASHSITSTGTLNTEQKKRRAEYARTVYPSQFARGDEEVFSQKLDQLPEYYYKVR